MIEIEVKTVAKDYEMDWQEQEYHDTRIEAFKGFFFQNIRHLSAQLINRLVIDCEYYPESRKFKITSISKGFVNKVNYCLEISPKFTKEFIL